MTRSVAFVAMLYWTLTTFTPSSGAERRLQESGQDQACSPASGGVRDTAVFDGIEFVGIPPGDFLMGSITQHGFDDDEQPVTQVRISKGFYLGKYEVTQDQWQAVMGSNPSFFKNCGDRCPVEHVSWEDVQEFIRKLNAKSEGARYRLPTEAEWEYAARAETTTDTYAGDIEIRGPHHVPILDGIAWYGGNSGVKYAGGYDCLKWVEKQYRSERCGSHPVGRKVPNGFGLHDMLGNVWEWVGDWYGFYPGGAVTDPVGPPSGLRRVFRGGSWIGNSWYYYSSSRGKNSPGFRGGSVGFRLLREQ